MCKNGLIRAINNQILFRQFGLIKKKVKQQLIDPIKHSTIWRVNIGSCLWPKLYLIHLSFIFNNVKLAVFFKIKLVKSLKCQFLEISNITNVGRGNF